MSKEFEYEYDPIKEIKNGDQNNKVIWSTNSINIAVDGLQKGLQLKSNPFIGKNTKLLKPDLVYKRTKEEIEDYIKCKTDPIYFASKCYLMTPQGLKPCVLRDYQVEYLKHLQQHRFSIFLSCRQSGKSTTTAIYCLWVILFNTDKSGLILSKSGPAGVDLLSKIKDMYLYLPYHLKIGTMKWNQSSISFDNNSSISTEAFSPTAGLGKTINFLILDEFAWCPPNDVDLFYNNIIPTVTTISDSNVCIMSTQNGFNLFYKLWKGAIERKNIYAPFKVDWDQVPQFNTETKTWEKRTEQWKKDMIGVLGSEESFYYQYGTQFSASNKCLVSRESLTKLNKETKLFVNRDELEIFLQKKQCLFFDPEFDLEELKTGFFIFLIDLAEGEGGDDIVFNIIQLIDEDHFKQVGYWKSNELQLDEASLEFWILFIQLNALNENIYISIEWNTYGALFFKTLKNLNEPDYDKKNIWRFNIIQLNNGMLSEIEMSNIIFYLKSESHDELNPKNKISEYKPGIKMTTSSKKKACMLLRAMFETGKITNLDVVTLGQLENFEDKNGNGSYAASYGHDDLIMTFLQIPLLKETPKFKSIIEDLQLSKIENKIDSKWEDPYHPTIFNMRDPYILTQLS